MSRACLALVFVFAAVPVLAADGPRPVAPESMPALNASADAAPTLNGLPLQFEANFDDGQATAFKPTDASAWKVVKQGENRVYALTKRVSDYKPPHRSPHNIALIEDAEAGTVVLDVRMQTAMTDYGHRSLCLFFNYVDPSHFYYVHFGQEADPHANQIFIVNDAARKAISETTTDGTPWDDQWHHARVVRNVESGRIEVYFDDMQKPVMTATDKTFTSGQVGIGSFDDAGNFDCIAVYAK